jgi:hypothetical protein
MCVCVFDISKPIFRGTPPTYRHYPDLSKQTIRKPPVSSNIIQKLAIPVDLPAGWDVSIGEQTFNI